MMDKQQPTSKEHAWNRRAEPFEQMQWFYRRAHDPVIRCQVDLDALIDVDLLRRAVDASLEAVPLIACEFDPSTCSWMDKAFRARDIVQVVKANSPAVFDEALLSFVGEVGPRLRIGVIRRAERDSLCIAISHMVCDGAGFKQYLYLLAALYSSEERGEEGRKVARGYPSRRDFGQVVHGFGLRRRLAILFFQDETPKQDPAMRLPLDGTGTTAHISYTRIEADAFEEIHRYASSRGATLNDALLAAYIRTLHRLSGCSDIVIPCPVDLRRYGSADERFGICNLTANYFCQVKFGEEETFDETLRKVALQMKEQKESDGCLRGPLFFHLLAHVLPFAKLERKFFDFAGVPVISYTNLGIIDAERLVFGSLTVEDAYIVTAVKQPPSFQLSISTFRGACTLTSCLYADEHDAHLTESLLDGVKAELHALQSS